MLHNFVLGLKKRRVMPSIGFPFGNVAVNLSTLPRPPSTGRVSFSARRFCHSVHPSNLRANLRLSTFQLPNKKSKSCRPSVSSFISPPFSTCTCVDFLDVSSSAAGTVAWLDDWASSSVMATRRPNATRPIKISLRQLFLFITSSVIRIVRCHQPCTSEPAVEIASELLEGRLKKVP